MSEAGATLLDGRVRYDQRRHGYRTGIEPVLLAAAVPARAGDQVIEAGCGAGAALLCLAWRVPGMLGIGVDCDSMLADLARHNAGQNGFADRLRFEAGTVEALDRIVPRPSRGFDHAMANPPWHDPAATRSPDPGRERAKRASPGLLPIWATALSGMLRHRGTLTLVLPAGQLERAIAALAGAGCGSLLIIPLWPRSGQPARLVLVQATRGGRAPTRLAPGLILHEGRSYTEAADRVLRAGAVLRT